MTDDGQKCPKRKTADRRPRFMFGNYNRDLLNQVNCFLIFTFTRDDDGENFPK